MAIYNAPTRQLIENIAGLHGELFKVSPDLDADNKSNMKL